MNIYNKNGVQITNGVTADLPITPDCRLVQELMKGEYVEMSWEDAQRYPLPVGSYIIPFPSEVNPYIQNDSRYPVKYLIFEEYDPEGKSEAQFEFTPQFQHPIMWLSRVPFVLVTGNVSTWAEGLKQTTWGYTGNVVNIANYVVDCINWISSHNTKFGNAIGTGWTAIVDNDLTPSATVNFEAVDIWSAAGLIAQAFDCEFHFDYARKQFRLGAIRYGTTVTLKSGDNVSVANVSRNKEGFANAFLVKGSTRNLSQPTDTGENAQVRERLTLNPLTYPDSMMYTNDDGTIITKSQFEELNEPILIKELIFDGVYPKLELYLYDLRERECWLLNELGEKVPDATNPHGYKTYSKWYCRLAYPVYNSTGTITEWRDYLNPTIIDGQTLQMTFLPNHLGNAKTSLMIGQGDFDVVYFSQQTVEKEDDDINENGFTAYPGDYRIVFKDESGLIIPTTSRGGIYPQGYEQPDLRANIATLINIVVDNTYKAIAQQELEKVAIHKVQLDRANLNNYTFQSNPVVFEANNISLHIGQAVSYDDGQDLNGGTSTILATHIVKIISQLDYPFVKEITVGNEKVKTSINTLQEKVETIIANLGNGNYLSESQLDLMIKNYGSRYFLSKTNDDIARGFITFMKGFQVGERFVTGLLGEGGVFRKDADGTTYIEADKLYIRMKAYFDTVEIRRFLHSGGNRIATVAGVKCVRVEWLDSSGNILEQTDANLTNTVKFRCYFRGNDSDVNVTNDWVVGDQAYCHISNVTSSSSLYMHHFWRLVVGKSSEVNANGEHYIDLSNSNSNTISGVTYAGYQADSDIPVAQDDIIQLGNVNDADRRGAIIEFVSGEDAPSYQVFQGLGKPVGTSITEKRNSQYSLTGKNYISFGYSSQTGHAYMKVYGDVFIGDPNRTTYIEYKEEGQGGLPELNIKANVTFTSPTTHQDTTLEDFASAVVGDLDSLQQQIDGSIETWFYGYVPTLSNAPASSWTTAAAKNNHLGDLFYDTTTGYAYRFANTGTEQSPVYEWLRITDTDVVKALADAAKAQDTADHKRRVFLVQPTPPYDAGDLWVNATYPEGSASTDAANNQYYNEILKCVTPKGDTGQFAITDWALASKYTDDSALINFVTNTYAGDKANLQSQIDGKAETWYQATDPATAWTTAALKAQHAGDLWYNTTNNTTWYYKAVTEGGTTTYSWEQQNIPQSVFDTIDGKSSIYVSKPSSYETNDIWIIENTISSSDLPNDCVVGDIVVATSNSSSYNKAHWQKKDRYTDDSTVRAFINSYGTILGITPTAQDVGQALGYLGKVLSTGSTQIDGGLVLTNILYMKDTANTPSVRAGISGLYKSSETGTGYKGHGTAAWFGGGVSNTIPIDHEVSTSASDYAKILFRFDGSGYLAGGNITWDKNGIVTIANVYSDVNGQNVEWKGTSLQYINQMSTIFPTTLRSGTVLIDPQASFTQLNISHANGYSFTDTSVLNRGENDARYVRIDFFNRLFQAYKSSTISDENKVAPNDTDTTINNLKIMVGTWTQQYLSALGNGGGGGTGGATALTDLVDVTIGSPTNGQALVYNSTSGKWTNQTIGGGGTDMATVWSNLAANTNEQINASHLTNALSGYATSSDLTGYLPLSAGSTKALTGNLYFYGGASSTTDYGMIVRTNRNVSTSGGWALNPIIVNGDGNSKIFNLGLFGVADTFSYCYIGTGAYNATNNLRIYSDGVKWGTNTIYHEGNFSTVAGGLFTSLTSTNDTNLSVTIGGTTKSVADLYAYQSKNVRPRSMAAGDDYDTLSNYTITRGCFVAMNDNNLTTNDVTLDDLGTYDTLVSFGYNLRTIQFKGNAYGTMRLKYRRVYQPSTGVYALSPWKEIAFADGNIATATALATARTLWGQSFDGTSNVSGNMTDVGTITGNGNITVTKTTTADTKVSVTNSNGTVQLYASTNRGLYDGTSGSTGWIIVTNGTNTWMNHGNVGIGTTTPSYKLHVSGVAAAQSFRSTVETGVAPMVVASSTLVSNLNADLLDGKHSTDFASASDVTTLQGYFDSSGAAKKAVQLKTSRTLWGQSFDGTGNVTGAMTSVGSITLTNNSRISNATGSGGSLYIGRADDAGWVKLSDMCSRQGDSYWKIKSNGDITAANIYSNGDLSCLSDARKKTVIEHLTLDVRRIAEMPIVRFLWKDRSDNSLQVGTLAQSWLSLLPEIVTHSKDDVYGVKYGVGAMCIGVSNSREIVNILNEIAGILNEVKSHDKRLTLLERENRELREEINRIKAA